MSTPGSLVEMAEIPVESDDCPAELADSHTDLADSPVDLADSPMELADSPMELAELADSPVELADSPEDLADSSEDMDSPVDVLDSPIEVTDSPLAMVGAADMVDHPDPAHLAIVVADVADMADSPMDPAHGAIVAADTADTADMADNPESAVKDCPVDTATVERKCKCQGINCFRWQCSEEVGCTTLLSGPSAICDLCTCELHGCQQARHCSRWCEAHRPTCSQLLDNQYANTYGIWTTPPEWSPTLAVVASMGWAFSQVMPWDWETWSKFWTALSPPPQAGGQPEIPCITFLSMFLTHAMKWPPALVYLAPVFDLNISAHEFPKAFARNLVKVLRRCHGQTFANMHAGMSGSPRMHSATGLVSLARDLGLVTATRQSASTTRGSRGMVLNLGIAGKAYMLAKDHLLNSSCGYVSRVKAAPVGKARG